MQTLVRLLLRLFFGFRAHGTESLATPGPVLLIPNHASWLDWLFFYATLDDDWRIVTSSTTAQTSRLHRRLMVNRRTFPVDTTSPYAVREMIDYLNTGGRLVLFAEGRITRTGSLMKIYDGTGFLVHKTRARVITCYLRGATRLPFVRHTGWTKWFPRITAHFSPALTAPGFEHYANTIARDKTTLWLRDQLVRQQFEADLAHGPQTLPAAIAETAAQIPGHIALEDATHAELTYRRLMTASDALATLWPRILPSPPSPIGIVLPNINAMPVVLLSLWTAGRTPAILNFTSGAATMLQCAQLAGIRQIITSRRFLEKARLDLAPLTDAGIALLHLEDLRPRIRPAARLAAVLRNRLACGRRLRRAPVTVQTTAAILFTSGSEGVPKGVELTHRNLLANLRQAIATIDITDHDRIFNALPLFHSFGLTAGLLFPLVRGCYTFLYPTPLHYRIVPALVYDRCCTVLFGTNTFLNGYARKAHAYDFNTLRFLIAGAEKVQAATYETWARKFGIRILEGYGATECSPILSLANRMEPGTGSAGRLLPGIDYKLEPVPGVDDGGRLFVRGPNIMKGYLNPEANAEFQRGGGWYDTGDIAHIDDERYVHIRGRMKRFAKISGEMVSLTAVEDALAGAFPRYGLRCQVAIIATPDADKGEKLVAVTNESRLQLADLRAVLRDKGLGNLVCPRELRVVHAIPKLGTGKINHRELQRQLVEAA
ncbi:AMP-dependent synthetase [Opitutaceae bacterium TAV4]|nr:AMP-dependent synthetase [Opitutaceae bacterium TAV4]RRJ99268.1 AMP-dependent synthetase [Opitutaceae bacterium TAV3]